MHRAYCRDLERVILKARRDLVIPAIDFDARILSLAVDACSTGRS